MATKRTATSDHRRSVTRVLELGAVAEGRANYPRAEEHFREALRLTRRAQRDAGRVGLRLRAAGGLARMHRIQGRYAQADRLYRRTLALAEERCGPQSLEVAGLANELGILCKYAGRFAEGCAVVPTGPADHPHRTRPRRPGRGQPVPQPWRAGACPRPLHRRRAVCPAVRHDPRAGPWPFPPGRGRGHRGAGGAARRPGPVRGVRAALPARLDVFRRVYGPGHYEVAITLNNLAAVAHATDDPARAARLYTRSLAIKERLLGPDHPDVAVTCNNMAVLAKARGRYAQAAALYRRALGIFEKAFGLSHPHVQACSHNLERLQSEVG